MFVRILIGVLRSKQRATPRLDRAKQGHAGTQGTEGIPGQGKLVARKCGCYFLSLFSSFLSPLILYLFSSPPSIFLDSHSSSFIAFISPFLIHSQPHSPLLSTQHSFLIPHSPFTFLCQTHPHCHSHSRPLHSTFNNANQKRNDVQSTPLLNFCFPAYPSLAYSTFSSLTDSPQGDTVLSLTFAPYHRLSNPGTITTTPCYYTLTPN